MLIGSPNHEHKGGQRHAGVELLEVDFGLANYAQTWCRSRVGAKAKHKWQIVGRLTRTLVVHLRVWYHCSKQLQLKRRVNNGVHHLLTAGQLWSADPSW